MSDESEIIQSETREGRRARLFKGQIADLLEDLIEAMEEARKEGFAVEFQLGQNHETHAYVLGRLELIKKW